MVLYMFVLTGTNSIGEFDYRLTSDYLDGDSKEEFLKKYLITRRNVEIELFKKVSESIKIDNKPIWLLNFIGKQDLWNFDCSNVEKHYTTGIYKEVIDDIKSKKNQYNFRFENVFGCLTIGVFSTSRGETLCCNCPGYGNNEKAISLKRLIATTTALLTWNKR